MFDDVLELAPVKMLENTPIHNVSISLTLIRHANIEGLHCIRGVLNIEVSAFQGVHIEELHCIALGHRKKCPQCRGVCISDLRQFCLQVLKIFIYDRLSSFEKFYSDNSTFMDQLSEFEI